MRRQSPHSIRMPFSVRSPGSPINPPLPTVPCDHAGSVHRLHARGGHRGRPGDAGRGQPGQPEAVRLRVPEGLAGPPQRCPPGRAVHGRYPGDAPCRRDGCGAEVHTGPVREGAAGSLPRRPPPVPGRVGPVRLRAPAGGKDRKDWRALHHGGLRAGGRPLCPLLA